MVLHRWSQIPYDEAMEKMAAVHTQACEDGCNHLILCAHPPLFTVGYDDKEEWNVPVIRSERGGSITCHSPGQVVAYFCFQVVSLAHFYRRVIRAYEGFFGEVLPQAAYRTDAPGFYVQHRKIASLGFRYRQGVSLHGVALNVDLAFHAQVAPCGLEGIVPTSLYVEGVRMTPGEAEEKIVIHIAEAFGEDMEA